MTLKIGTVIRGNEFFGEPEAWKRAVTNSLRSLAHVLGAQNVIILLDEQSSCDRLPAYLFGSTCHGLSHCRDPVFLSPTMDCLFTTLLDNAKSADVVGFINGDIMVFDSFVSSIRYVSKTTEHFLMVGKRHNNELAPHIDVNQIDWDSLELLTVSLPLENAYAVDYFITRAIDAHVMKSMPPFIIGTMRWDNVLLWKFLKHTNVTVFDATSSAPIMHQVLGSEHAERPAATQNHMLAVNHTGEEWMYGTVDMATYQILRVGGALSHSPPLTWGILKRCFLQTLSFPGDEQCLNFYTSL